MRFREFCIRHWRGALEFVSNSRVTRSLPHQPEEVTYEAIGLTNVPRSAEDDSADCCSPAFPAVVPVRLHTALDWWILTSQRRASARLSEDDRFMCDLIRTGESREGIYRSTHQSILFRLCWSFRFSILPASEKFLRRLGNTIRR